MEYRRGRTCPEQSRPRRVSTCVVLSLGRPPRSGTVESLCHCPVNVQRHRRAPSQGGRATRHARPWWKRRALVGPGRPPFRLRFSGSGCDVESICISLITNDIERPFIPLLAVGIFPLERRLFRPFPCLDWVLYVFHYGVVRARCIPRHRSLIRRMTCKYCFPFLGLSRNFLDTTS